MLGAIPPGGQHRRLTALPSPRLPEEARHRRVFEMVEALQEHPRDPNQILIGYSRGLVVIWDLQGSRVLYHFLSSQVGSAQDMAGAMLLSQGPKWPIHALCRGMGCRRWECHLGPACCPLSLSFSSIATGEHLVAAGRPPARQLSL